MNVTIDPVWPWSRLLSGESSGSAFGWVTSNVTSLLLVAVPLALILITVWTYFNSRASYRRMLAILALRLLAFLLAFAAILRPSFGLADRNAQRGLLIVVVDGSESMTILDEIDNQTRWAYLQKLLKNSGASLDALQDKQNVDIVFYRFAADTTQVKRDDLGYPDGNRTDIGSMLRYLYENRDGKHRLLGLLVLSDGADNGTRVPALTEAVRWRNLPCPVHTFGFGNSSTNNRESDIAVTAITTQPAPVPVKAELQVKVKIDAPGFINREVQVQLYIDDKPTPASTKNAILQQVTDNEVTLTTYAPDKPGEIKVTVRVDPQPGEITATNNEISTYVTVSKEGLSVLLVDKPRDGEPQSISDALNRDRRIRVTNVWLFGDKVDPNTAILLDCDRNPYDVVILGDVTARQLDSANPLALKSMRNHVTKGGGLLMIGGYNSFGNSDWSTVGKVIGDILPVDLSVKGQETKAVNMKPTERGFARFGYILKLTDKDNEDKDAAWNELNKSPLEGMNKIAKRDDLSVVLAEADGSRAPILITRDFGGGRVLAFAGDTTWRWKRDLPTLALQRRFWQRMIIWLAKQDETEGSVWVRADKEDRRVPIRSDVGFTVGMKSKTGAAIPNGVYEARVIAPSGEATPVLTTRNGSEQRGIFTKANVPGEYRIEVSGTGKDEKGETVSDKTALRFLVYDEDVEMQRRAADHEFLKKLSSAGGGKFHQADQLLGFFRELQNQPDAGLRPKLNLYPNWRTTELSPFLGLFFVLFVLVVSGEWLLRRRWGMV
jgi:uncharacterized membrane protein